jgi:hypothetical protein
VPGKKLFIYAHPLLKNKISISLVEDPFLFLMLIFYITQNKYFIIIVAIALLNISCFQMYNLQDASLLSKKNIELMGSYSPVLYYDHPYKSNSIVSNQIGFHLKYGVSNNFNATFNYVLNIPQYKYISNIHFISFGGKFPLIKDLLAFYIPFGIYFNNDLKSYNSFIIQPTIITSFQVNTYLKINLALSYICFFEKIENTGTFSVGFDFLNLVKNITFRPEISCAGNLMTNGIYYSFNIGISYTPLNDIKK